MDFRARPFQFHCLCMALWTARPRLRTERFWAKASDICDGNSHKIWEDCCNTVTDWIRSVFLSSWKAWNETWNCIVLQIVYRDAVVAEAVSIMSFFKERWTEEIIWEREWPCIVMRMMPKPLGTLGIFTDVSDRDRYYHSISHIVIRGLYQPSPNSGQIWRLMERPALMESF